MADACWSYVSEDPAGSLCIIPFKISRFSLRSLKVGRLVGSTFQQSNIKLYLYCMQNKYRIPDHNHRTIIHLSLTQTKLHPN